MMDVKLKNEIIESIKNGFERGMADINLRDSILMNIAKVNPYSFTEIKNIYLRFKSFDAIIYMVKKARETHLSLYDIVNILEIELTKKAK